MGAAWLVVAPMATPRTYDQRSVHSAVTAHVRMIVCSLGFEELADDALKLLWVRVAALATLRYHCLGE